MKYFFRCPCVAVFNSSLVGERGMPQSRRAALCAHRPCSIRCLTYHSVPGSAAGAAGVQTFPLDQRKLRTDRQTALKCQSWCSGGEMHTDNEIPIGLFLSCSGQLPPISSFQNDATGQISLSLPSNRW